MAQLADVLWLPTWSISRWWKMLKPQLSMLTMTKATVVEEKRPCYYNNKKMKITRTQKPATYFHSDFCFLRLPILLASWLKIVRLHFPWSNFYICTVIVDISCAFRLSYTILLVLLICLLSVSVVLLNVLSAFFLLRPKSEYDVRRSRFFFQPLQRDRCRFSKEAES